MKPRKSQTHRTADDEPVKVGMIVYRRIGGPRTGRYRWHVRRMQVSHFVGRTRVRLESANPRATTGATCSVDDVWASAEAARMLP